MAAEVSTDDVFWSVVQRLKQALDPNASSLRDAMLPDGVGLLLQPASQGHKKSQPSRPTLIHIVENQ
jgi:hypothetical protein